MKKYLSLFFPLTSLLFCVTVELCSDMIDVVLDVSGIYGLGPSHEAVRAAAKAAKTSENDKVMSSPPEEQEQTLISQSPAEDLEEEIVDQDSAYDNESASVIRLNNGMVRLSRDLACTCLQMCTLALKHL